MLKPVDASFAGQNFKKQVPATPIFDWPKLNLLQMRPCLKFQIKTKKGRYFLLPDHSDFRNLKLSTKIGLLYSQSKHSAKASITPTKRWHSKFGGFFRPPSSFSIYR